uniref:Uncharacterized protein n=1 Tax=viral metagenome TaxID=1070528 RepID=A0A2V0RNC0_9ZZZZ
MQDEHSIMVALLYRPIGSNRHVLGHQVQKIIFMLQTTKLLSANSDSVSHSKVIHKVKYHFTFDGIPLGSINKGRKGSEIEISEVKSFKESNMVVNLKANMPALNSANISAEVFRKLSGSDRTIREFVDQYDQAYARAIQASTMFTGTDATPEEVQLAEAGLQVLAKARKERAAAEALIHKEFATKIDALVTSYGETMKNQNAFVIIAGSTIDNVPFMDKVPLLSITDQLLRTETSDKILASWKQELLDFARQNNGSLNKDRIVL